LVYSKFALLTPLDRIRRDLAERGIHMAMSTLVTLIERAAGLLDPVDGLHWRTLLEGSRSRWRPRVQGGDMLGLLERWRMRDGHRRVTPWASARDGH